MFSMQAASLPRLGKSARFSILGLVVLSLSFSWSRADDSSSTADWKMPQVPLVTKWAAAVSPTNALPEYPRPQMVRKDWMNLNGLWDYGLTDRGAQDAPSYTGKILVPYPYESALSGIAGKSIPHQRLWYHRTFSVPTAWNGQRVLLHFGAVNWDCTVAVNGKSVGAHKGGYTGFDFDITDDLSSGDNDLVVSASNPLLTDQPDAQVLGKQRDHSFVVFYTSTTGIWQTVWLEPVPVNHIVSLKMTPDIDNNLLHLTVQASSPGQVAISASDGSPIAVAQATGASDTNVDLTLVNPHLWSPDDPHLYDLKVTLLNNNQPADSVTSYFGMRKVSLGKDDQGRTCVFLNNKAILQIGLLDQGFWPDGIYTAATDDALHADMDNAKKLNFNLMRKHAKVEPQRWYYWADKLGFLVWQDMPQAFAAAPRGTTFSDTFRQEWLKEWQEELDQFHNSPSIIVWTPFNENWGVHDIASIVDLTKKTDPSRLIDSNTGGDRDMQIGDFVDDHAYPGPGSESPETSRAAVNGEFGGITMSVPAHRWTKDTFGYGTVYHRGYPATKRYQELMKAAYKLVKDKGTCAFVYTEITDVEEEINGLYTYDREVMKMDPAIVAAANKGEFPSMPPDTNTDLVPTSEETPITWNYTTDRPEGDWSQAGFDDSSWKTGTAPFGHDIGRVSTQWTSDDIWIRRKVTLPQDIPPKLDFMIFHDEDADIYINGVEAATIPGASTGYVAVPLNDAARQALQPGDNTIAVHVHQTVGGQFIDLGIVKEP